MGNPIFDPNKCPPHSADEATTDFIQDPSVAKTPGPIFDSPDKLIPPDPPVPLPASANRCSWIIKQCGGNAVRYVGGDLAIYQGKVVRLSDDAGCWLVVGTTCSRPPEGLVSIAGVHGNCRECQGCFRLEACDSAATKVTNTDLSLYMDRVVRIEGDPTTCWRVRRWYQCGSAVPVKVSETYEDCDKCDCYKLESCSDNGVELWTFTDLSKLLGKVVRIAERAGCWLVADKGPNYCSAQSIKTTVLSTEEKCDDCECVVITACDNGTQWIVTNATNTDGVEINLEEYKGQAIRDAGGTCCRVDVVQSDKCSTLPTWSVEVLEAYDDCQACVLTKLKKCGQDGEEIVTYSDLSPWSPEVGNALVDENGDCWEVKQIGGLSWTGNEVPFDVKKVVTGCQECEKTYKLSVNCYDPACQDPDTLPSDKIVKDPKLVGLEGQWIKIDGFCYYITAYESQTTESLGQFRGPFPECEMCLSATGDVYKTVLTDVCEANVTGTPEYRFKKETWLFRDGVPILTCDAGSLGDECFEPAACPDNCNGGDWSDCTKWPDSFPVTVIADDPCGCLSGTVTVVRSGPTHWNKLSSKNCFGSLLQIRVYAYCSAVNFTDDRHLSVDIYCEKAGVATHNHVGVVITIRQGQPFGGVSNAIIETWPPCCKPDNAHIYANVEVRVGAYA